MTKTSAESEPDVSLLAVAVWFLFLWAVSQIFPAAWKPPWSFNGWFSSVLSVASWFVGGLATVTMVMIYVTEERKPLFNTQPGLCSVMAGWGFVFFGLVAFLHFINGEASVRALASTTVAEHSSGDPSEGRIEKFRGRQKKLGTLIVELEAQRSTIMSRLRQSKDHADLQVFGHEFLDIDRSLKRLKDDAGAVALTIAKGEALLREKDRQKWLRDAGLDSNELAELRVEIEEWLRSSGEPRSAGEAIQVDRVIREAVGENR